MNKVSGPELIEQSSRGFRGSDDVRHRLKTLSTRVAGLEDGDALERLVSEVSEAVERITVENAGMAEELLSVYEQLGIVFEVTQKLPTLQSESEVIDLFVDNLRRSFQKREVFVVHPRTPANGSREGMHGSATDWFDGLVCRARDSRRVMVESPPLGAAPACVAVVTVGPVFAGESFVCAIVLTRSSEVEGFHASDMLLLDSLTMFCGDLIRNHRLLQELREMSVAMVRSLVNAVDQKDQYTSGHSLRVGYFASLLGKTLNLTEEELQMLQWGALLHDVGKIGIRDDVLNKKGGLTEDEFNHIKEHPVRSHRVVQEVPQLAGALEGVLHHHERFDGAGYPSGLTGEDIPLQARIIQIADVFDALTSDRAYRPAYNWGMALDILREEAGKTVDPQFQKMFDGLIREQIEDHPDGWKRTIERANRFTPDPDEHCDTPCGG